MTRFQGRTALITGAAGDIGGAVASRLASEGASLILADHPSAESRLEPAQEACMLLGSPLVEIIAFDVTDHEAVEWALRHVAMRVATPDLLFNNAGYQGEFANLADVDAGDASRVLDVNVKGVLSVLQMFAQHVADAGTGGAVVNSSNKNAF